MQHAYSGAQLHLTLCDPLDCTLPGSSVHGNFQAKTLEWVAISSNRQFPNPEVNPHFLHLLPWQANSLPLCHLGSPP